MNVELTGDLEHLAKSEVESGRFHSLEDFIKAAINRYAVSREQAARDQREASWDAFNQPFDLATTAAEQGVGPIDDPARLKFDDWPPDESVETFIARARGELSETEPSRW